MTLAFKKHCKKQYGRHLFVNAPVQNRQAKSEKKTCFSTFWPQFFGLQHLFLRFRRWPGPGADFWVFGPVFRTDFRRFVIAETLGFYSVFLFSACSTASFKISKNLVNYAVLCYGVNENIVNTSVFWRWLKKHCKLQCFWQPDPQKPWYLQWFLLLTAQKHCK